MVHCSAGETGRNGKLQRSSLNRKNLNMITVNTDNPFQMNTKMQEIYWEI
jgi:phosphopantothenoylcysteine synthetase/decarboxylase